MGKTRMGDFLAWWASRSDGYIRLWCVLGMVLGLLLIFGGAPL